LSLSTCGAFGISCVTPCVIDKIKEALCKPYSKLEVETAPNQMRPHKAPGLEGLNPFFSSNSRILLEMTSLQWSSLYWKGINFPWLKPHFCCPYPQEAPGLTLLFFYSISPCNVIYKLVTKVISNHLQPFLANIVSET